MARADWLVYMLECADGTLYTGITNDLERRIRQHNAGTASRYTRSRLPVELVYSQEFPSAHQAFLRERQVKGWSRANKQALIQVDLDQLVELSNAGS